MVAHLGSPIHQNAKVSDLVFLDICLVAGNWMCILCYGICLLVMTAFFSGVYFVTIP